MLNRVRAEDSSSDYGGGNDEPPMHDVPNHVCPSKNEFLEMIKLDDTQLSDDEIVRMRNLLWDFRGVFKLIVHK